MYFVAGKLNYSLRTIIQDIVWHVNYSVRSKMTAVKQTDLISRPLPIDGMGYY